LRVTVGSKAERNDYSGFEVQPSVRLVWSIKPEHTLVLSVARAVRTPSRIEQDLMLNRFLAARIPAFLRLMPNKDFQPEKLIAYEVGYRVHAASSLFLTLSTFANQYQDLLSTQLGTAFLENTPSPIHAVLPFR